MGRQEIQIMGKPYSAERKERTVRRLIEEEVGIPELARQTGIGRTTLWRWKKEALEGEFVSASRSTPEARSASEKMRLVLASEALEGKELGAFLRAEGVHSSDLRRWKDQMCDGLNGRSRAKKEAVQKLRQAKRDKRELESELRRKEAALAEAAALLVLSKKARRLWGDEDAPMIGPKDK
jgi:transposase-like protein